MDKVRVGVIGTGALGRHHARLYRECSSAEVVGVYDIRSDVGQTVGAELGVATFTSADELADAVDALSVAVPTDVHQEVARGLLERGKHVLVEKPLAANAREGRALVDLAITKGVVLRVGHVENFNPVITYLRSILIAPIFIEAHRLAPYPPPRENRLPRGTEVGVVHDLMIHDLDLLLDLVGCKPTRVEAVGMPVLSSGADIANARILFENACVANVTASRISPEKMRKIRVFQPDTYVSLDYDKQEGEIHKRAADGITRETVPIEPCNALKAELEDFIDCIQQANTGRRPILGVSGERALAALELADEISSVLNEHIDSHDHLKQLIR